MIQNYKKLSEEIVRTKATQSDLSANLFHRKWISRDSTHPQSWNLRKQCLPVECWRAKAREKKASKLKTKRINQATSLVKFSFHVSQS